VNAEEIKYVDVSRHQNARQNRNLLIANNSLKCGKVQVFGNKSNTSKWHS